MVLRQRETFVNGNDGVDARHAWIGLKRAHPVEEQRDVLRRGGVTVSAHRNGHRRKFTFAKCASECVECLAARHALRKDAPIGSVEFHAEPWRTERNQEHQGWHGDGERAPHDATGEACPAALLTRLLVGDLAHGEAVHSCSEHAQQGGKQREAGDHGERHGDSPGDANRAQYGEVEEHEANQAEHDGDTTKEDGATSSRHSALHRKRNTIYATRAPATELLAESRDHQ